MELTYEQKKAEETLAKVLAKAWDDETFKNELITSPVDTIEKFTGEKFHLKAGAKMVVVDQSESDTFYFNVPSKPDLRSIQLTEEELEMVAGGGNIGNAVAVYRATGNATLAVISYFF